MLQAVKGLVVFSPELEAVADGCTILKFKASLFSEILTCGNQWHHMTPFWCFDDVFGVVSFLFVWLLILRGFKNHFFPTD